jgi:hypothetical protein
VNNLTNILNLVTWSTLQLVREILREASRSGKSIEQLLDEAEKQTELNDALITSLKAKLSQAQDALITSLKAKLSQAQGE